MRCGEKCFIVTMETDGEKQEKIVNARTTIEARKTVKRTYGDRVNILAVRGGKESPPT